MKRQQQPNDLRHGEAPSKKTEQLAKTAICKLPTGFLLDIMTKLPSEAVNDVRTASMEFDRVFLDHQELFQPPADMEGEELLDLCQDVIPNADGTYPWTLSVINNIKLGDVSAACIKNYLRVAKNLSITIHGPLPNYFGGKTRPSKEEKEAEEAMKAEENEEIKGKLKADLETTDKGAGGITDLSEEEAKAVEAEKAEEDGKRKKKLKEDWERMKAIREREDKSAFEKMKTFVSKECKKLECVFITSCKKHNPIEHLVSIFERSDLPREINCTFCQDTLESQKFPIVLPKLFGVTFFETLPSELIKQILDYKNLGDVHLKCSEFVDTQLYVDEWKRGLRKINHWTLKMHYDGPEQLTFVNRIDGMRLKIESSVLGSGRIQLYIKEFRR